MSTPTNPISLDKAIVKHSYQKQVSNHVRIINAI